MNKHTIITSKINALIGIVLCLVLIIETIPYSVIKAAETTEVIEGTTNYIGDVNVDDSVTPKDMSTENLTSANEIKKGDIIIFGSYEQDNDSTNGFEAIEWIVLSVEDNKALLLSKYGLEQKSYHDYSDLSKKYADGQVITDWSDVKITWEECNLRYWLNKDFYDIAFSKNEKACIIETDIINNNNTYYDTEGGKITRDRIFLPSLEEMTNNNYSFDSDIYKQDINRRCKATEYAKAHGVWTIDKTYKDDQWKEYVTLDGDIPCYYWLRSPGKDAYKAASISAEGECQIDGADVYNTYRAVRPALYVDLAKMQSPKPSCLTNTEKGDVVIFGSYEQDNNYSNGGEPIEWLVLSVEQDKALLLSKYALEYKEYNTLDDLMKRFPNEDGTNIDFSSMYITWEKSTLRDWLNADFYNNAFSENEKTKIIKTLISDDNQLNVSDNNSDFVFLLSIKDILNTDYGFSDDRFEKDFARLCVPTIYTKEQGVKLNDKFINSDGELTCLWTLSTVNSSVYSTFSYKTYGIHYQGYVDSELVCYDKNAIRPAIWIDISTFQIIHGDVNDDGELNAKDVTQLRRYLAGGWNVEINKDNSDVNSDGELNAKDVTILRRFLAGGWGVIL
jgi:hypothetical protein